MRRGSMRPWKTFTRPISVEPNHETPPLKGTSVSQTESYRPEGPETRVWMPNYEEVPPRFRHLPGQPVTVQGWYLIREGEDTWSWWGKIQEMPGHLIRERCLALPKTP